MKTKVKKVNEVQMSKSKLNNAHKESIFSMSGIIRYIANEGAKDMETHLKIINNRYGSKISANQITIKKLIANMPESYLTLKNGDKRSKFSYYFILHAVSKIAANSVKKAAKK